MLSGRGISQIYARLPQWIVSLCKCYTETFPLQTLQSEGLLLKNLVCIQQKVSRVTRFMGGPTFVHGLWGFGCVGKGIFTMVGMWRNELEYSLSSLWTRLLLSLETHFFEVVFCTSFYTTASVNYKLQAYPISPNGHSFPSDLTPVPHSLLRSHLSRPHLSMCAKVHYREEGFEES